MASSSSEVSHLGPAPTLPVARLFVLAPLLALAVVGSAYFLLRPQLPAQLARHIGPDGVGLSSTGVVLLIGSGVAAALFVVALCCAIDFWKHEHWYQTQKMMVVGFAASGYAVSGLLLASIFNVRGVDPAAASGASIGYGLLAFLVVLIIAIWSYVVLLPAGKFEEPWGS
ncbi:hypothetical protein [Glutamicibacter uratoxydans]|uniref:hypothetical protein n=1 Tax=Glutamicibacter uratoxydans TaxID=43667 RepID=UPI003D6EB281